MNIASIYPNGVEKTRDKIGGNFVCYSPEIKSRAMDMISKGVSVFITSKKTKVDYGTLKSWMPKEKLGEMEFVNNA